MLATEFEYSDGAPDHFEIEETDFQICSLRDI